jgi:hypothetical protein
MTRRRLWLAAFVLVLAVPAVAGAYLKIGILIGPQLVGIQWKKFPVRYFITDRGVAGVSAAQLRVAVDQSFAAWTTVPTALLSSEFIGFTSLEPSADSGQTVIGFESRPALDTVLGATSWEFDAVTGEPRAAHIFLNSIFPWSVAAAGEASRFDVRAVATHEIGHLFGLGHSAIGETQPQGSGRSVQAKAAVMFPISYPPGRILDRTLQPDDVAGISDLYGAPIFRQQTGQIRGRVTLGGVGLFGAHVTAFDSRTGAIVGAFSLNNQGEFVIGGLAPGLHLVRVEPLDDADLVSFFDPGTVVNINFKPAYHPNLVAVPPGGAAAAIEIKVVAR